MKFNKISKKLAACSLAGVMMVSMLGMTVCAESAGYTPSADSVAVKFNKVLNMEEAVGASTPGVEFKYTVAPGETVAATSTTPEIKAGVGQPTIDTVTYDVGDTDLTKEATVNFKNVTFKAPGIYRYIITETPSGNNGIYENITDDTNTTRILDVYVQNVLTDGEVTGYKITNSVLTETALTPVISADGSKVIYGEGESSKSFGYTNKYSTWSLTLNKTLAGTMADYSKDFSFTIVIKGMQPGSKVTVDRTTFETGADDNGNIVITKTLGNGEKTEITGIPANASYEITEDVETKDGYTPSIEATNSVNVVKSGSINGGNNKVTGEMRDANAIVSYINTKNAVTPTGIAMTVAPYILMVAVAGIFAVLFLRRRHEEA